MRLKHVFFIFHFPCIKNVTKNCLKKRFYKKFFRLYQNFGKKYPDCTKFWTKVFNFRKIFVRLHLEIFLSHFFLQRLNTEKHFLLKLNLPEKGLFSYNIAVSSEELWNLRKNADIQNLKFEFEILKKFWAQKTAKWKIWGFTHHTKYFIEQHADQFSKTWRSAKIVRKIKSYEKTSFYVNFRFLNIIFTKSHETYKNKY